MKTMEELYGGDFPVQTSVVKNCFTTVMLETEKPNAKKEVLPISDKKEEVKVETHRLTKKKQEETSNDLAIIDVTPKKFSLRGYKK